MQERQLYKALQDNGDQNLGMKLSYQDNAVLLYSTEMNSTSRDFGSQTAQLRRLSSDLFAARPQVGPWYRTPGFHRSALHVTWAIRHTCLSSTI